MKKIILWGLFLIAAWFILSPFFKSIQDGRDSVRSLQAQTKSIEQVDEILKGLTRKFDEFDSTAYYQDKATTKYLDVSSFHTFLYRSKNNYVIPYLKIQYVAEDWLFIKSYQIKTDTASYLINPIKPIERDHGNGKIWEWYVTELKNNELPMLKDVATSKQVKIRFNGDQYQKERTISTKEKQAVKNVLAVYDKIVLE